MQRPQPQQRQRMIQVVHARAAQRIAQLIPRLLRRRPQLLPIQQHHILIPAQIHRQPGPVNVRRAPQILHPTRVIAISQNQRLIPSNVQPLGQTALPQLARALVHRRRRNMNRPVRRSVAVVVKNNRPLTSVAVRVRKHVLIHRAVPVPEVVQHKVRALCEDPPPLQQRRNLMIVPRDQRLIRPLLHLGLLVLHAVALGVTLHLSMRKHRQPRQRRQQRRHPKALISRPELVNRRPLIRVRHEVHIPLQNVRIELNRLLQIAAILRILLIAQHVHERRVVHAMHAQRAHKIPFEQPERLRQQQRSRHLRRHAVHHLAPELMRHQRIELFLRHRIFRARRNRSARPGQRKPQPLHMPLRQHHRRVKPNDRKQSRHVQDGLDHLLAYERLRVIDLRRIVPRKRRPIVAVIHVPRRAVRMMPQPKHHRRIRLIVVVVLDLDLHPRVRRQIRPIEAVRRKRALPPCTETSPDARSPSPNRCPCGSAPCRSPAEARSAPRDCAGSHTPNSRPGPPQSRTASASTRSPPHHDARAAA